LDLIALRSPGTVLDSRLLQRIVPPLRHLWPAALHGMLVRTRGRARKERTPQASRLLQDDSAIRRHLRLSGPLPADILRRDCI